jgi:hypothetical protein
MLDERLASLAPKSDLRGRQYVQKEVREKKFDLCAPNGD